MLSPEPNQGSSSNSDNMYNMTGEDVVVKDRNSSSTVSSKDGSMDVKRFIEVVSVEALSIDQCVQYGKTASSNS